MLVAVVIAFVGDIIQVKWKPSTEQMKPKLDKFNPISGFKRIFSVRSLVQLAKSVAIVAICVLVTYNKIKKSIGMLFNLYEIPLQAAIYNMGDLIISIGIVISVIYLIVGIGDYLFELFKFKEEMKMTKQEVKDEWKETEGSPEVKSAVRRKMMEASRRRMMQAVPEADVVITNPTHFAVALKYEPNSGQAPVVIAKGEDYLAQKIKEVARENQVEIVENKPLARMLYYNVELGMEIPQELYQAVAEVLAFVWKLKHKI
jgi:flagellar biosynthetic protein FlhB